MPHQPGIRGRIILLFLGLFVAAARTLLLLAFTTTRTTNTPSPTTTTAHLCSRLYGQHIIVSPSSSLSHNVVAVATEEESSLPVMMENGTNNGTRNGAAVLDPLQCLDAQVREKVAHPANRALKQAAVPDAKPS